MANQFNNMQMGVPIPDIPPITELWKEEKHRFRHWIILLGVGLLVVLGLYFASLIWNVTSESSIKDTYSNYLKSRNGSWSADDIAGYVATYWQQTILVFPIIVIILVSFGTFGYGFGVANSYRKKSFAEINGWATMLIGITAFFSFYELISMAWRGNFEFQYQGGVFQFIARLLVVIVALTFLTPVSNIRRMFVLSKRVAEFKASAEYQAMMQNQGRANNTPAGVNPAAPFGVFGAGFAPQTPPSAVPVDQALPAQQLSKQEAELNALSSEELKAVAKKFSISGHESMDKGELIKNILRVSEATTKTHELKKQESIAQLEKMSLSELKKVANRLAISGADKMTKAELIASIKRIYEK